MILRSFLSSGDKVSSSTSTSSLSKYCMSSGFIVGRFPFGCRSTTCVLLSGVCIRNPTGVPASGVGVAVSLRAGVRIGTYPAGGCRTYSTNTQTAQHQLNINWLFTVVLSTKRVKQTIDWISAPSPNFIAMATKVGMVPLNRPSLKTPW